MNRTKEQEGAQKTSVPSAQREANTCIALGVGVGTLGAAGALLSGAVCPLCYVVVPGLIGAGVVKRWQCRRRGKGSG